MENALISVIVPVYNADRYLNKCIFSILNQTYKNIEIILINDGSVDNSLNLCMGFAKIDKRVKVFNQDNEGVDVARNVGINVSRGDYLAFVDSDDYLESSMIEKLVDAIEKQNADLALCKYKKVYQNKVICCDEKNLINCTGKVLLSNYINFNFKYKKNIIQTDNIMSCVWRGLYKRNYVKKIKFEGHYCEDLLFNINYIQPNFKIAVVNEYLYNYFQHEDSALHRVNLDNFKKKIVVYKNIVGKICDKIDPESLKKFKFYIYKALYIEAIKLNGEGLRFLHKDDVISKFNSKENLQVFNKQTKSLKTKISNYLIYKDREKILKLLY